MRLGPQGLRLLNEQRQLRLNGSTTFDLVPQLLDFVLNELVHPSKDTTTTKILSYLAYYYPSIKNEDNIKLLTYTFMRCPLFFNESKVISFEDNYKLIEFFNYIISHKFSISLPHLSFQRFFQAMLQGFQMSIARDPQYHWKMVPVIAGILSTTKDRNWTKTDEELIAIWQKLLITTLTRDRSCIDSFEVTSTSLLAASFAIDYLPSKIPDYSHFIVDLIYLHKLNNGYIPELNWQTDPALKNVSRLAKLTQAMISNNFDSFKCKVLVEKLVWFSKNLNQKSYTDQQLLKTIVFTNIVIFESIINQSMIFPNIPFQVGIARNFLTVFSNSNFIIDQIGTGGFNSYNFVYYYSIDVLLAHDVGALEVLVLSLMSALDFAHLESNIIQTSNLKFLLILIENVVTKLSPRLQGDLFIFVESLISTQHNEYFKEFNKEFQVLLESAHSVILKYIDMKYLNAQKLKEYVLLIFEQYPRFLSLSQISICVKRILMNNLTQYDYLDSQLTRSIIYCRPDILVPDQELKTLRASLVSLQILTLEFCPIHKYQMGLESCYNLMRQISDEDDFILLRKILFESILTQNRIDNQKGEIGIRFWYQEVENRELHL